MILKENYNGKTTLKQWWQIVRDNFRTIAENAVSKKELDDSVSNAIIKYVSEDMEALENVRKILAENDDVTDVLNASITNINNHKADTENPHRVTAEQLGLGNVKNVEQASKAELDLLNAAKTEIICGTYNITDKTSYYNETERVIEVFINLGFTPEMVEVYRFDGVQSQMYGNNITDSVLITGGMAMTGYPCSTMHYGNLEGGGSGDDLKKVVNHIEIAPDGFYVRDFICKDTSTLEWKSSNRNSVTDKLHYFKAYKNINIVSTGDEDDN